MAGATRRTLSFPIVSRILLGALLSVAPFSSATAAEPRSPVAATATEPQQDGTRRARDPLAAFQVFLARLDRGQASISSASLGDIGLSIADLRLLWATEPALGHDIAAALLDLAGHTLALYDPAGRDDLLVEARTVRNTVASALAERFDGDLATWISHGVLARPQSQPLPRRRAAAWFLIGRRLPGSELALLTAARDPDPRLRAIALEALVGAQNEAVHRFFVEEFGRVTDPGDPLRMLAERHLRGVQLAADSRSSSELTRLVRRELVAEDWRAASQAIALTRAFADEAIVPWLIEALATWAARAARGAQALRVEHEIELELEHRSGRRLGLHPENWRAWWEALRSGKIKKASTPDNYPEATRPSFFGLDPQSDRVLFVIDRSGSMEAVFDPRTRSPNERSKTRWEEAVHQLCDFVEALGDRAKFDIVLFHEHGEEWRGKLVVADDKNLRSARSWLTGHHPNGGTHLRKGIDLGLHIGIDGTADLEKLEADTVIVLCDGATAEGPSWVGPFLKRENPRMRIVFHCVQIGEGGNGTLEALARESGGEFVRIER